ncbi:hypothetical protein DVH24_028336 [Malus domestica]|uniref:Uncharacterized protein n=1 Tax=Malus domestica TaxID=3750 RepID=A0A498HAZ3_MALDO|nr:hypothetical protein DVH24_028336 [Malus domestica]
MLFNDFHVSCGAYVYELVFKNEKERGKERTWMGVRVGVSGITHIYQKKLMHERVQQFLPLMWKASEGDGNILKRQKLIKALCVAAERGHVEYIFSFLKCSTLDFDAVQNEKGQNLYQIAAECRHHKIYNLIHVHDQLRKNGITLYFYPTAEMNRVGTTESYLGKKDDFGNNMLHTVATISPSSQIHDIQGAALQMQRELQWFKQFDGVLKFFACESRGHRVKKTTAYTSSYKFMEFVDAQNRRGLGTTPQFQLEQEIGEHFRLLSILNSLLGVFSIFHPIENLTRKKLLNLGISVSFLSVKVVVGELLNDVVLAEEVPTLTRGALGGEHFIGQKGKSRSWRTERDS